MKNATHDLLVKNANHDISCLKSSNQSKSIFCYVIKANIAIHLLYY